MDRNIINHIYLFVLCTFVTSVLPACSSTENRATYYNQIPSEIGDGWETASLEEAGIDSRKLAAMMGDINDGGFENLHSLLIVKDGRVVFEEYFRGNNQNNIHFVASVTKSVTSIMIGIAIKQGLIEGTNQYLTELLPSYSDILNADPLKQKLQLKHILTMTSGLKWDESTYPFTDMRNDAIAMDRSADAVLFVLDRPTVQEPGTQFQYGAGNSMLLSAILEEATGMTVADYARVNLFEPLGISQFEWKAYADGHTSTDGGLFLRPRDMAKIGQLMLNEGQWNGVQIIPAEWVAESTQARISAGYRVQYGYQWWRENQAIYLETVKPYFAAGHGGQLISVYPDQNIIMVFTSDDSSHGVNSSRIMFLQKNYLLPATIPALFSKTLLWIWYILALSGLGFIIFDIVRGQIRGFGWSIYWLMIGAIYGPIGVGAYILSYRNQHSQKAPGWRALGTSFFFVTGYITGFILLALFQVLFRLESSVFLLVIPLSFLVSWLAFIAPATTIRRGTQYWKAALQTLLTAVVSTCLTLIGIIPVLILLFFRWFPTEINMNSPLFWITMPACAIAGAVVVYPYSYWMARRNLNFWP